MDGAFCVAARGARDGQLAAACWGSGQVRFLVQRVLVTTDLPSWDLQLRSDPPSYALGATTNY